MFFSDSTGPCYHSDADEPAVVDFGKLENQTRRAYDLAVDWGQHDDAADLRRAGFMPAATYADAVILDEVLTAGLADLGLLRAGRSDVTEQCGR